MRRSVKTAAVAIVMGMALAAPVYAMTGGELKAAHTSEYTSGTESVYGPALTQAQLDTVAQTLKKGQSVSDEPHRIANCPLGILRLK